MSTAAPATSPITNDQDSSQASRGERIREVNTFFAPALGIALLRFAYRTASRTHAPPTAIADHAYVMP